MAACGRIINTVRSEINLLRFNKFSRIKLCSCRHYSEKEQLKQDEEEEDFRVFQLFPTTKEQVKYPRWEQKIFPPRTEKMATDQDWPSVWPGPRTFHPGVVPLPLRQGRNKHGPPPDKYANLELMKIPNFLHLTPPAIKRHCEAIKKFCTKWPTELNDNKKIEEYFPVQVITSDYCHSSPTIRDPNARIVSLQVKLGTLNLDKHAKDKFLRLVGKRYNPKTDIVTITTDSCPLKSQNYDYAQYLLTALYFESQKYEDWENLKQEEDLEYYDFWNRKSVANLRQLFEYNKEEFPSKDSLSKFAKAVEKWHNSGDATDTIEKYKTQVMKLLGLPKLPKLPKKTAIISEESS